MRKIVKLGRTIVISMMIAGGLTACGGGLFTPDKEPTEDDILLGQSGRTLWETGLQYVKIVNRDVVGGANEHPESLTSDQVRTVLSSLYVVEEKLFKTTEAPLFSRSELQILSTALSSGFAQAQSNEDINFVSIGSHSGAIAKEKKTTTGRVFISDGRLNIVFGLIHELYRDKDIATGTEIDRRLHPLLPGKRSFDSEPEVRVALDKGQSYYLDPKTGKERSNWIVIDIATVLATAQERKAGDTGTVTPELLEDVARSKQDSANLRHDVGSMKEIIFEMSEEIESLKKQLETLKE
ncbi:hypothetical protein N9Y67_01650 [Pseudomonadota bacterium]|nr:hypothetical protein [Pseudomonadota bacterium]